MKVKEAMHKGVEWVSPATPVATLASKMRQYDIGAIPVGDSDHLIGMVTDRDIAIRALLEHRDPSKLTAGEVMTPGMVSCQETDEVSDAVQVMEDKRVRRLPVLDAHRRMVGMLSLGDISHAASAKISAALTQAVSAHHA